MEMDGTRGPKHVELQGNKNESDEFIYRQASVLHRDTDEMHHGPTRTGRGAKTQQEDSGSSLLG